MKRLLITTSIVVSFIFLSGVGTGLTQNDDNLTISGSTTVLPIGQKAVEVFNKRHPNVKISISGTGSGDGIKALIDSTTNIAMSSREIKSSETQQAAAKNVQPKEHIIAFDGIVPIVNPKNSITNITLAQLRDIYTGKITNWKDVGGTPGNIVVISRDSSSGTFEAWGELVLNKERVTPAAQLQASNGAVAETVAKTPNALGYVGIGYAEGNSSVKGLSVEGIKASADTVINKTYKISRPLYMFTNGEPKGATAQFIAFMLSPEGQQVVKEEKFVPLPKKR
ncbi:MAG: PstS family phosphate ABC transporter substrate-binding protein [Blastocatellia bacterium]|nr:PstS family phosphate ABC transporter substrate-binding protein [Blastocatellia bacterium]